jgi:hypothetical protein
MMNYDDTDGNQVKEEISITEEKSGQRMYEPDFLI